MSLAGIREMSTILTPPEERYPVLTYVGPHDDKQIAAALRRELLRDGQAFYVHNRVSSIDAAAARVRELVPEAKVAVAHGQMHEDLLETTVEGFWNREFDILVCTTIVETGLDISNANTLIVERADTFGLSQLHQLRGRVGRSRERGYAYFLYPQHAPLTETAYDRLATIAQNNELGAGMAVAMKDLEIRGAGNVLGAEQSGHVAGVGFDLYVRLVGEAVEAYRAAADGQTVVSAEEPKDVRIDLPVDAHLPPDYIPSDRLRLEGYRRLAAASHDSDIDAVVEELTDRYGALPETAERLVAVARLRLLCRAARHHRGVGGVGGHPATGADDSAGLRAGAPGAQVPGCALPRHHLDRPGSYSAGRWCRRTTYSRSRISSDGGRFASGAGRETGRIDPGSHGKTGATSAMRYVHDDRPGEGRRW